MSTTRSEPRPGGEESLPSWFLPLLVCPACHGTLELDEWGLDPIRCTACLRAYPWLGSTPVLIEQDTPDPQLLALAEAWNRAAPGWRQHLDKPVVVLEAAEAPLLDAASGIVLEIGCGDGRLFPAYRAKGLRAIGLDFSAVMLQMASSAGFPLLLSDAHHVPLRDGCVDTVLVPFSTIRYLDYPAFFAEAHRLLSPQGILGFTAWNAFYNGVAAILRHSTTSWKRGRDVRGLRELLGPLTRAGFVAESVYGVFSAPRRTPWRARCAWRVPGHMAATLARDIGILARRSGG